MTLSHSAGVMSRKLWRMLIPALLMRTSTPPMSWMASAKADCTCSRSETSAAIAPLRDGISREILLRASASRSRMQTTEPSSRKRAAVAAPIPLAPPVIRIRFAFSPRTRASPKTQGRSGYLQAANRAMPRSYRRSCATWVSGEVQFWQVAFRANSIVGVVSAVTLTGHTLPEFVVGVVAC